MLPTLDDLDLPWKDKLAYLTHKFLQLEQTECPVKHILDGDKYIREMRIPAGSLFIGRVHINGHLVQLVEGTVTNVTEAGKQEISAPYEFKSAPGYQAVFFAQTDIVGRTVHENPDRLMDLQALEDRDFESVKLLAARGEAVALEFEEKQICQE